MELYTSRGGDITLFSDDMYFEEQLDGYILWEDVQEYYMDDIDITIYNKVDSSTWVSYKNWCDTEVLNDKNYKSLIRYKELLDK